MKRIITLLLAAAMCLSLAACGGNNPAGSAWVGGQMGNAGQIINTTEQKYDYAIRPAMWIRLP